MLDLPYCIVGTTASGKTELSLRLAEKYLNNNVNVLIISLDAFQVYKGMDIGTGKIATQEMKSIPHFGIDLVSVNEEFTVVDFKNFIENKLKTLKEPTQIIYVGGSSMYVKAIVDKFDFPPQNISIRNDLETIYKNNVEKAYDTLNNVDPLAASNIEKNNFRRIIRALEVIENTGKLFSSYSTKMNEYPISANFIGLYNTRTESRQRITKRVETMFSDGWEEEVLLLKNIGFSKTSIKAIGYNEILVNDLPLEDLKNTIINKTVKFSRRQRMWLKNDPRINWYFGDSKNNINEIVEDIYVSA